ncbi:MAG: alpha/beta hydrolase [bacterium]|nr:alpha/beta hydrolase [bacterium]
MRHVVHDPITVVEGIDASAMHQSTPCGDGSMIWRVWGSGTPLLLLHGGHGSWTHWIRVIPQLSQRFRVIAPDLPGLGESAMPPEPYSGESLGAIVASGLDEIVGRASAFSVVGFSFGGIVGGHLAALREERVRSLVLVGSGGLGLPRGQALGLRNWRTLRDPEQRLAAHRHNLGILMIHDAAKVDELALYLQSENTRRARLKSRPIAFTDTLRRALTLTGVPLAGIWGECDATVGSRMAEYEALLRSLRPSLEFRIIEGAGHWVPYESPQPFVTTLSSLVEADTAISKVS